MPLSEESYVALNQQTFSDPSYATVALTRRGVEIVDTSGLYEVKALGEEAPVLSIEQAINLIKEKFQSVILKNTMTMYEMRLRYVATIDPAIRHALVLKPTWVFCVTDDPYWVTGRAWHFFDAGTGQEM